MSNFKGNDDECPICGLKYRDLRTGYSYAEVRMLLWVADPDYSKWKYKRRHTVLGLWHQIKQAEWREHLLQCERYQMHLEAQSVREEEAGELNDVLAQMGESPIPF